MPSFEIETYKIRSAEKHYQSQSTITERWIYLESPQLAGNSRCRASLEFGKKPPAWEKIGLALNAGGANSKNLTLMIYLPVEEFKAIHEALVKGSPARLLYMLDDLPGCPTSTTKYVSKAAICADGGRSRQAGSQHDAIAMQNN